MKRLLVFVFLCAFSVNMFPQVIQGTKGKAVKQSVIKISSLKEGTDEKIPLKVPNKEWEIPQWSYDHTKILFKEPIKSKKKWKSTIRETSPMPDTTFAGLMDNNTSIPPDVQGAAGLDHLMETLNTQVRIMDKQGNDLFTTSLSNFWAPMPNNGATFDPRIVFDPYNDRWIMVTPSGSTTSTSRIYIGVSTGSDPLDEWYMYWIDPDTTNQLWFDYPNVGFNKNWISIGGIMRNSAFEAVDFVVFAIDKQAVFDGEESPAYQRYTTTMGSAIVPSCTYDSLQQPMYFISTGDGNSDGYGYINLFKLSGDKENPVFQELGSVGVPEPWENWSYENDGDFLPQMGSTEKLNSVDARMHTLINRNDKLWAVHHIYLPADDPQRCAVQWWNLDTTGVILERGRIDDTTNTYSFAFPSIAVNANEDVFIGHGIFSENQYAGAGYSYKAHYDDSSSMREYYQYKEGLAPYYKTYGGDRNRWGDYSAVCVDPVQGYDFWALHEYAELPGSSDQWGTWWASLKPSFPPIADFIADEILIPTGETINFQDLTVGIPDSWNWTFEQGQPASSSDQNPKDVLFDQEGSFDVTLIVSNTLGSDTIVKENYITTSSTLLPEVHFDADKKFVCTGETVSFTDMSLYSPIQWEWQFTPSTVTFVNGTDQNSQNPQVVFDEDNAYAVSLTVWNLNGSSEDTEFDMILAGGYLPDYTEDFEPETFKPETWEIENPDDDITWAYYTTGGTTPGETSAGVDFYHYYVIGQRDRLISPPVNLKNMNSAFLEFQYAYARRVPQITDSLIVYVSGDCGENWTRVFAGGEDGTGNFATHEITDNFWPEVSDDWCMSGYGASCISIDLAPWLGSTNVKVAFESWSGYGNPLFIDNINIHQYLGEPEIKNKSTDLEVYPNPARTIINLKIPDEKNDSQIKLINQFGQIVFRQNIVSTTKHISIPVRDKWSEGMYFLQLISNNNVTVKAIIIQKD